MQNLKIDPKKIILWMSGDPMKKCKYTSWIARPHPSGSAPFDLLSVSALKCLWEMRWKRREKVEEGEGSSQFLQQRNSKNFIWIPGRRKHITHIKMNNSVCTLWKKRKHTTESNGFTAKSDRHVLSRAWIEIRPLNLLFFVLFKKQQQQQQCQYNYACGGKADGAERKWKCSEWHPFIIMK